MSAAEQVLLGDIPRIFDRRPRPCAGVTIATLVCSDVLALALVGLTGLLCTHLLHGPMSLSAQWLLAPLLLVAVLAYAAFGLYAFDSNGSAAEELRKTAIATTIFYLGLGACTFLYHDSNPYLRTMLFVSWGLTLFMVPILRSTIRRTARRAAWWGYPAAVVGTSAFIEHTLTSLTKKPGAPLVPIMTWPLSSRYPDFSEIEECCAALRRANPHCILLGTMDDGSTLENALMLLLSVSARVLYVPDAPALSKVRLSSRECGGKLALEIRNMLRIRHIIALKRVVDLAIAVTALALIGVGFRRRT